MARPMLLYCADISAHLYLITADTDQMDNPNIDPIVKRCTLLLGYMVYFMSNKIEWIRSIDLYYGNFHADHLRIVEWMLKRVITFSYYSVFFLYFSVSLWEYEITILTILTNWNTLDNVARHNKMKTVKLWEMKNWKLILSWAVELIY